MPLTLIASTGLGALCFIGSVVAILIGKPSDKFADDLANRDGRPPSGPRCHSFGAEPVVSGKAGIADAFARAFGDVVNCPQELRLPSNKVGGDLGKAGEPVTHTHKTTPIRTSESPL